MKAIHKQLMAAAVLSVLGMSAHAATSIATMAVTLNNVASVSVLTTPVVFGDVATSVAAPTATGSITVNATNGLLYKVSMDGGLHRNTMGVCRGMTIGAGPAGRNYQLYSDPALSTAWGDSDLANSCPGTSLNGGSSVAGTGTGLDQVLTVHARAFSGATIGLMSDTVTVTVTY